MRDSRLSPFPGIPPPAPGGERSRWRLAPLFFAAGGLALTAQVLLLRDLMAALQGDETAVALGLAAWLAGIAGGALLARAPRERHSSHAVAAGLALLAAAGPAGLLVARLGRLALAPPPGEVLSLGPALLLAVGALAPAGGCVGWTFTALAAAAPAAGWRPGQGLAWLYILESAGSLAAGLAVTFILIPRLNPWAALLISSAFWILAGAAPVPDRFLPGRSALIGLGLTLGLAALPSISGRVDAATVAARFRGQAPGIPLLGWVDTPYQQLAVGGGEPRHLYSGGQYAGSFPDPPDEESLARQILSLPPRARTVLLIGTGQLPVSRFLLEPGVTRIDLVEPDARALALTRRFLPAEYEAALRDPRLRLLHDDPRRFLLRPGRRYDLILVLEPPPVTLLLARLSTVEFYRLCARRLDPEGVLVVRLETAPNVLTGETAALAGSIWGALRSAFPVVRAGPGPEALLVAGTDPRAVTLDPAVLAERFVARGIPSEVFVPELFPILFPPERVAGQESELSRAARRVPASRDERPVSFLHALSLRQRAAGSGIAPLFAAAARIPASWLFALALLPSLVALGRIARLRGEDRSRRLAAFHAVTVTGGCGMAWSLLILFSYQTRAGALYGRLGLLTALFMLGLSAGSLLLSRSAELSAPRARRRLLFLTVATVLFALAAPPLLRRLGDPPFLGPGIPELAHAVLLLAAGIVTGSLFPVASGALIEGGHGVRETAGGLEAADHWGAAGAALMAGIIYIPALGLAATGWLLAFLQSASLAGVLLARRRRGVPDPPENGP